MNQSSSFRLAVGMRWLAGLGIALGAGCQANIGVPDSYSPADGGVDAAMAMVVDAAGPALPDAAQAKPDLSPTPGLMTPDKPELWYWHSSYLTTDYDQRVEASEALIDRAVAAGYTGIAWYDSSMQEVLRAGFDTQYQKAVISYATSKGLKTAMPSVGLGASGAIVASSNDSPLGANPNWGEGPPVVGQQFRVVAGGPTGLQLQIVNSVQSSDFGDGGFESGMLSGALQTTGFTTYDDSVSIASSGCHSGNSCAHIASGGTGNERLYHPVALTVSRQYHLSMWVKVVGYQPRGGSWAHIDLLDGTGTLDLLDADFPTDTGGVWQQFDFLFNSKGNTQLDLIMGIWGGFAAGDVWVDDVSVEEVGLVNVTRRDNTPLKMYKASDPATVYMEGTHFNPISDPLFLALNGNLDVYHAPPTVSILAATGAPQLGDTVAIDYHAVKPFYETLGYAPAFACLTTPGVQTFNGQAAAALSTIFPAGAGFFMGYDELRVIDNCAGCKSVGTPGEVLAQNAANMIDILVGANGVRPGAPVYTWSDMFDPFHNAHANYYEVDGDLAGSWKGLSSNVILFNWHPIGDVIAGEPSGLAESLAFFAGMTPAQTVPHNQIISGYYDPALTGDAAVDDVRGCTSVEASLATAAGVPGVLGVMYTTWSDDYSQLEGYASCAQMAWADYLKSLP